ncbi:MFS transporter [Bradyrhizobium sp. 153]|uniref:spinster family MFS transporter n=1 Tax=Bradyrhizobium sp. 153 TaxID=2782627 RepID=UPI001FFAA231|nr:MFS transporter [Bradyrhizobium sp. 153]MCK1667703.1 MFS transporter [Bradyrhizobium sp. 153]
MINAHPPEGDRVVHKARVDRPAPALKTDRLHYAYFIVFVLMLTYMLSFLDRVLISLLIGPIKAEFGLTDTEIGALIGFGFVLFYSVLGVPLGALADRMNRRNLILYGLVGWSAATSATAGVSAFAGLLATRAAVGVGEAALSPAAISTIGDRFPRERFGLASSIYSSGIVVGSGLALLFGGIVVQFASQSALELPYIGAISGWRLAMLVVGSLGLPMALFIVLTVREAPRRNPSASAPSMQDLLGHINKRRTAFASVLLGYSLVAVASYAPILWGPALFMRVHGLQPKEVGLALGLIVMLPGLLGMIAGGALSDFLSARGRSDAPVRIVFWSCIVQLPFLLAAFTIPDRTLAWLMLAVGFAANSAFAGLTGPTLQLLAAPQMRGRMMAIYLLCANLFGIGLGPLVVGILSDKVFTPPAGLAYSVAATVTFALACSIGILALARRAIHAAINAEGMEEGRAG